MSYNVIFNSMKLLSINISLNRLETVKKKVMVIKQKTIRPLRSIFQNAKQCCFQLSNRICFKCPCKRRYH